jgi:hypothetical protein
MTQEEKAQDRDSIQMTKLKEEQMLDKAVKWLNDWLTDEPARNCAIPITKDAKDKFLDRFRNYMKE